MLPAPRKDIKKAEQKEALSTKEMINFETRILQKKLKQNLIKDYSRSYEGFFYSPSRHEGIVPACLEKERAFLVKGREKHRWEVK